MLLFFSFRCAILNILINTLRVLIFMLCYHNTILLGQTFTNVSDSIPLNIGFSSSDKWGSGVSFYDFNQDGWDDISICMENDSLVFFMNDNGVLIEVSSFVFGDGAVKHLLWVDYDNDGHLDLFVSVKDGQYRLFKNDGNFNFSDVTVAAGLSMSNASHWGASFADIDNDGYLDLYLAKYSAGFLETDLDRLNQLYHNNGDGTFTNITLSAGVGDSIRPSFQGIWFDYDLDGYTDLYVINDRVLWNNTLYRNNGDLTFTDVTEFAGLGMHGQDPMTLTIGDFDNDGDLDIYLTNTGAIPSLQKKARLYVNNGDGTFTNQAEQFGVDCSHWSWGALWIDYDNDTWQDLLVATGLPNTVVNQDTLNHFYINQGGQYFTLDNSPFPSEYITKSYSLAKGDINNDGYADILILNNEPDEPFLWQNSGGSNNYIKITPQGTVSNKMAIGTWVKVFVDGQQYTKYTFCGENYIGQDSQHLIFGLSTANNVDSLIVTYTSGHTDKYYNLSVNKSYVVTEGETLTASIVDSSSGFLCVGDTIQINLQGNSFTQVTWSNGDTSNVINVFASGLYYAALQSEQGVLYYSDTVELNFLPAPFLVEDITNISCHGGSDGAITINEVPSHMLPFNSSILWSDSSSTFSLQGLSEGTYFYEYTTDYGCFLSGQVQIESASPILLNINVIDESGNQDGEIDFMIFGGTQPYQSFLDGNLILSSPIENLSQGAYVLTIKDANECIFETTVFIGSLLSNFESPINALQLYPNPNFGMYQLNIELNGSLPISEMTVFDQLGRTVFKDDVMPYETTKIVDNSFLLPGVYTVLLSNESQSFAVKLVIQ